MDAIDLGVPGPTASGEVEDEGKPGKLPGLTPNIL